jgi:hypothetical protein
MRAFEIIPCNSDESSRPACSLCTAQQVSKAFVKVRNNDDGTASGYCRAHFTMVVNRDERVMEALFRYLAARQAAGHMPQDAGSTKAE